MKEECGNCKFSVVNPQDIKQRFCRYNPPTVFLILLPGPMKGTMNQQFSSAYAPVQTDWTCSKFQPKMEMVS